MLPTFIGILDIQSWWEVPSIAYFCSLFRAAFNLLDFDIEELEEALLTDGTEDSSNSLLTELIVRLLSGCLGSNDISAFNYQMYLRRLFRKKYQETGRSNPFDSDIDFQFLPLRTKVEILYALCDFRLDAEDVFELFKNLEADSLRVEPLGWDDNQSAYWYFYGTRLYREDFKKPKGRKKKGDKKKSKKNNPTFLDWEDSERVWQVVCFTESDWTHLTDKFKNASSRVEKELYQSLSQNFLPEIPRLFQEKERLQRKRLLDSVPRRTSSRVLQKIKRDDEIGEAAPIARMDLKPKICEESSSSRESRGKRKRESIRSASISSDNQSVASERAPSSSPKPPPPPPEKKKRKKRRTDSWEPPVREEIPLITGRKTNNSLSSSLGQFMIPDDIDNVKNKTKVEKSPLQSQEEIETDMYKILEQLTAHEDAWPFMDPVEEEYAPNYYAVIRRPMDLKKMEKRLVEGYYKDFKMFENDFKLIVNNCRLYNGQDNEYTTMVDNLQHLFNRLTTKYATKLSSSDEEASENSVIRHSKKRKSLDSKSHIHKAKRRKSLHKDDNEVEIEHPNNSKHEHREKKHKSKEKRKHKGHKKERRSSKSKQKHHHHKNSKKKQKRDKSKSVESDKPKVDYNSSFSSFDDMDCSRSPSPLPSIHTLSPSPPPSLSDKSTYGEGYDKSKDKNAKGSRDGWDSLMDYRKPDGDKQNVKIFETDKNPKLRETIEKLKAKNDLLHERSLFNDLFLADSKKDSDSLLSFRSSMSKDDTSSHSSSKDAPTTKKKGQKSKKDSETCVKNESTSEALEQAVKDIAMWLDDTPPGFKKTPEPFESETKPESETVKEILPLKDEKKPTEKTEKIKGSSKKRDIQRTIERLQPGKSKGNLIISAAPKEKEPVKEVKEEPEIPTPVEEPIVSKSDASAALQLGSVLPTDKFGLGTNHNFEESKVAVEKAETKEVQVKEKSPEIEEKKEDKINIMKDVSTETARDSPKLSQEKATPNLSAWFKAFGAPKSTGGPTKKGDEDSTRALSTPSTSQKNDNFVDEIAETPDRSVSPLAAPASAKQRRTSTGSSVSERSSFSQDLDSPRHLITHSSPLLRSPASPRTDDIQKAYSIVNGTVRAGFYQDTTSVKSSPEKSCSPREAPSSPHTSQHVYANCNALTTASNNIETAKSIFTSYGLSHPSYYENPEQTSRAAKTEESYTATSNYQSIPAAKEYSTQSPSFSYFSQNLQADAHETKSSLFPVKKRYSDSSQYTESYDSGIHKPTVVTTEAPIYKSSIDSQSYLNILSEGRISDLSMHKSDTQLSAENLKTMKSKAEEIVSKLAQVKAAEKAIEKAEALKSATSEANQIDYSIDKYKRAYQEYEASTSESNTTNSYSKHYEIPNMEMNYTMAKMQNKPNYTDINKTNKNVDLSQRRHDYSVQLQDYENVHNEYNFFNELLMRGNSSLPQPAHTGIDYGLWKNDSVAKDKEQFSKLYNTAVTDYSKVQKSSVASTNVYSRPNDNYYGANPAASSTLTNTSQCELRIPNPRGISTTSYGSSWTHSPKTDAPSRTTNTKYEAPKSQKYPPMTSFQNTSPYPLALDTFRNIPNLPQMIERYAAEEKYLNTTNSSLRNDMLQMTSKNLTESAKNYIQTSASQEKYIYSKPIDETAELKKKGRKAKTTEPKQRANVYPSSSTADLSNAVKSGVAGSAFNFGAGVPLESSIYGDNSGFSLDGLRSSATNSLMAANYMAAVAHQRMNQDSNLDKSGKSTPQSGNYSFPSLMRHPQVRSPYPFVGTDPTSPLYQQYLQRHQEELLRHTGAQIMGLYPDFSGSLGIHQPFDSINRPSWL